MGSLHAWTSLGDGASPDIQAIAKGLGGGYFSEAQLVDDSLTVKFRYVTIGAVLMSKRVADGIRSNGGFWKHGHTYQVCKHSQSDMCFD